jgi:GNAT superfamily N-acetyltransferase
MQETNQIIYRPAEYSDVDQMAGLMNNEYKRKKDRSYFIWQYLRSSIPAVSFCAFYKDSLIGISGIQKKKLENGLNLGHAIDSIVLPEWRGKGVFQKLCSSALNYFSNLDALYAFTNLPGTNAYIKHFNWRKVYKIGSYLLTTNNLNKNIDCSNNNSFYSTKYKFRHDDSYRDWRFFHNPEYVYHYIHTTEQVFSVVKLFTDPSTQRIYGDIVDFRCDIHNAFQICELISASCDKLFQMGCEAITTWSLPNMLMSAILKEMGFVEDQQERYFIINVLNENVKDMYDIKNWHIVQADAELY